ncbi:MAG: TetR/AcrR family transcriptional regulator [Tardiphaga sp.]
MVEDDRLRTDARLNRDRILDVARDALAADPNASLNLIGKTAGVGAGTLYRHFPSREALVLAVYRKEIDALVALAPQLLNDHPPLAALRLWCDRGAQFARMKRGMADTLQAVISDQDFQETYRPIVQAVGDLMKACEGAGDIRPGINPEDVLALMSCLWRLPPTAAGEDQAKRILGLIFRGLGARD